MLHHLSHLEAITLLVWIYLMFDISGKNNSLRFVAMTDQLYQYQLDTVHTIRGIYGIHDLSDAGSAVGSQTLFIIILSLLLLKWILRNGVRCVDCIHLAQERYR
jgi:hypothetical protein